MFDEPSSKKDGTYELEAEIISNNDVKIGTTDKNNIIAILDFLIFCIKYLKLNNFAKFIT